MVNDDKIVEKLRDLVIEQRNESFTNPSDVDNLDALGILVAKFCGGSDDILKVFYYALEDANFHDLSDKVKDLDKSLTGLLCHDCLRRFGVDNDDDKMNCPYCGSDKYHKPTPIDIGGDKK